VPDLSLYRPNVGVVLFNTAGRDYRAQRLGEKFAARDDRRGGLSDADALALLAANGNLVKRPFVIGPRIALVGFDEARWAVSFGRAGSAKK